MSERVTPAERLMNLVLALFHTNAMTKQQIRDRVDGYANAKSEAAFARMFERDKDLLRGLGIPLVTLDPTGHPADIAYRIDRSAYALPPIEFTAAELSALTLAGQLWQESEAGRTDAVSSDAKNALTKLRGAASSSSTAATKDSGRNAAAPGLAVLRPRTPDAGPNYRPLLGAIRNRCRVAFDYRSLRSDAPKRREVEPWLLGLRGAGWYLVGRDLATGEPRVFRLSRISGSVQPISGPGCFVPPRNVDLDTALDRPASPPGLAHLALAPGRGALLRVRATASDVAREDRALDGFDLLAVPYDDETVFADELAGFGADVVVLEPPSLVEQVVTRLIAAAALAARAKPDRNHV